MHRAQITTDEWCLKACRLPEAEPLYRQHLTLQENLFGKESKEARAAIEALIRLYEAQNNEDNAAAYRARLN